ncbi:MAG: phage holin family protein [Lapillicoccus sp.]
MTTHETATHPAVDSPSLGEIISDISTDLSKLVQQELDLAKAEVKDSASRAGKGAGLLGGAGIAGHMVLLFLSLAAWRAFDALVHSLTWAALIVALIWAVIAVVLALSGRRQLTTINGIPRTVETAKKVPAALKGNEDPA